MFHIYRIALVANNYNNAQLWVNFLMKKTILLRILLIRKWQQLQRDA